MSAQLELDVDAPVVDPNDEARQVIENAIRDAASVDHGRVRPNAVRAILERHKVPSFLVGQEYKRLRRAGRIAYDGLTEISDDTHGGNAGKIHRTYVWIGAR